MTTSANWLILVLTVGCAASTSADENWPQFRGPNASGVATSNRALPSQLRLDQNLVWKTAIPHGVSSPSVWKDRVFLTGHNKEQQELVTVCLDSNSGAMLWQRGTVLPKIPPTHNSGSPAAPSTSTDGQRLYVYFGLTGLTCYDFDGNQIWKKALPVPHNRHGASSSPILVGDLLVLVCDQGELFQSMGSYVLALNKHTGSEIWRKERALAGAGWSTPLVWSHDKSRELIVMGRRLIAYDTVSGEPRWWVDGMIDYALATPVLGDGLLFAATAAGGFESELRITLPSFAEIMRLHDVNQDRRLVRDELPSEMVFYKGDTTGLPGDGVSAREAFAMFDGNQDEFVDAAEWDGAIGLWNQMENVLIAVRPGGEGDVTKSHIVWKTGRHLPEVPSPLYYKGHLYMVKNGGIVSCLDAGSGKLVYRKRLGATGNYFASPIAGDDKVYIASDLGVLTILQAGETPKILSRNDLGEPIIATPAIAHGKLFARTAKHLYCFEAARFTEKPTVDAD